MTIEWNKVTWYSKLLAVIVFVGCLILGFYFGMQYGESRARVKNALNPEKVKNATSSIQTATTPDRVFPVIISEDTPSSTLYSNRKYGYQLSYPADIYLARIFSSEHVNFGTPNADIPYVSIDVIPNPLNLSPQEVAAKSLSEWAIPDNIETSLIASITPYEFAGQDGVIFEYDKVYLVFSRKDLIFSIGFQGSVEQMRSSFLSSFAFVPF